MDKRTKNSNGSGILDIKTGIGVYRGFTFVSCVLAFWMGILSVVFSRGITEILVNIVIACILLLMVIFMKKIVFLNKRIFYLLQFIVYSSLFTYALDANY